MWLLQCLAFASLAVGMPAWSAESNAVHSARMTATIVSDTDRVTPGQGFRLALRLRMAPGWHSYWSNPGDAGAPPELALNLPPGAVAGPIAWPPPQRLAEDTVVTYAYTGELLLPLTVTPPATAAGDRLPVEATAKWLVCANICVPEEGVFRLDLPWGTPAPSAQAALIDAAAARAPTASPFVARVTPGGVLTLSGEGLSADSVRDAAFFPADEGVVDEAVPPRARVEAGQVRITFKPGREFRADGLAGVVVLRDPAGQERAVTIAATPAVADAPAAGLAVAVVLALAGGLLLNLMPCVFPILAMKAAAIARSGQAPRTEALSYLAGVLVTSCGLGAGLMAARSLGLGVGWGSQFQSPLFVAAMAWVLFGVGLNLSGVFQVGGRATGIGQAMADRGGLVGSFFTGLLAVLVATPCTAPFMGGAIAAALVLPPLAGLLVFAALGVGLAAPYLALAFVPGIARVLPRPGAWMDVLKGALAFPMYAAAAWLVWVASVQSGSLGVLAGLVGLVLVGVAAWVFGLSQRGEGAARRVGQFVAAAALAGTVGVLAELDGPVATAEAEPYSATRLAELRAEGRPVFVNMTAAWCVTCLVNERLALAPARVRQAFADGHVAYLKGDWTRQDAAIGMFLRGQDRDGVPLYVFFRPGAGPEVLPQVLTEAVVLAVVAPGAGKS